MHKMLQRSLRENKFAVQILQYKFCMYKQVEFMWHGNCTRLFEASKLEWGLFPGPKDIPLVQKGSIYWICCQSFVFHIVFIAHCMKSKQNY